MTDEKKARAKAQLAREKQAELERKAKALRENLRRRKETVRARDDDTADQKD